LAQKVLAGLYGVVCHSLFLAAVATMIVAMHSGMSRSLGQVPEPWSILANGLLLAQFPILHSLLLTRTGATILRRCAPRKIGSHLATTTYVIVAAVQVLLLFSLWTPSGTIWWRAEGPTLGLLTGLYASAWVLLLKAIWDAGIGLQIGLTGWWAIVRDRAPIFPRMPTKGLFRIVRQPIYVAFALTLWTVSTWTPDQLALAITLTGYCFAGPLFKEARFRRRFGEPFEEYARRVPYWLPWPRRPRVRNDLSIYDMTDEWWDGRIRWVRTLRNLVPARLAFFDPMIGTWRNKAVLDLGCGGGFMSEALSKRGASVTGIDPSIAAIEAAQRHANANGLPIKYRVGGGESLGLADATFDVVVCVDVLEHVSDLDRVLREIRRVLRPGGVFLFDTINRNPLASFLMVSVAENVIRLLPRGTHDPKRFIRPNDLRDKLEAAGFEVRPFSGIGPSGLNRQFDITFGPLPTTAIQYLGQARAI
jgi:ubiquinone biosynthesis O-methyltransferase